MAALLITSGLGLGGCWTRVTMNRPLQPEEVAFIVPHETTWDEVTGRLGAPDKLVRTADGLAADYVASDSKSFSIDFGWSVVFVAPEAAYAPHQLALGREGTGAHTFQVAFDARGIVSYAGFLPGAGAAQYRLWPFSNPRP